jgi:hypothetical protein
MKLLPLLLLPLLALPSCAATEIPVQPYSFEQPPPFTQWLPSLPSLPGTKARAPVAELRRSGSNNALGNPIWTLSIQGLGEQVAFNAVTGRGYSQGRDRNRAGTKAPLPLGQYRIGTIHQGPFPLPELGDIVFIDLQPQFATGRSELGIHLDPSYERDRAEDGTDGCVGLTTPQDIKTLTSLISQHNITTLNVLD